MGDPFLLLFAIFISLNFLTANYHFLPMPLANNKRSLESLSEEMSVLLLNGA